MRSRVVALRMVHGQYQHDFGEPSSLSAGSWASPCEEEETVAAGTIATRSSATFISYPCLWRWPKRHAVLAAKRRAEPNYAAESIDPTLSRDREAGATRILRDAWEELKPRVAELIALRERMADFQDQRYEPDTKNSGKS